MRQIKGKFIAVDTIESSKILLLKDQALRGKRADDSEVNIVKFDTATEKVLLNDQPAALLADVQAEAALRIASDESTLLAAQAYANQKIEDLVGAAPQTLDTLKEIADAINNDASIAATLTSQIGQVQTDLSSEISERQAAVSAEEAARIAADDLKVNKSGDTMSGKLTVLTSEEVAFETSKSSVPQAFGLVAREQAIAGIYDQYYIVNDPSPSTNGNLNLVTSGNVYLDDTVSDANFKGSVWRIDNGKAEAVTVTVASYNNPAFSLTFVAPAYSRIFVISPVRVTHTLTSSFGTVSKSANTNVFNWSGLYGAAAELSKTQIQSGKIKLFAADNAASLPVSNEDVVVKQYVDGVIADVQSTVNIEQELRQAADSALQANLDAEITARSQGDASTLSSAQAYADEKVAALVASAPAVLDTLKELSTALGDDPNFAATVAGQIGTLDGRLDVLEAKASHKFSVALSATDIANGYVDLPHLAESSSTVAGVGRVMIWEGESYDYSVSEVGGVTRLTFLNSLAAGGVEALTEGDVLHVQYRA